MLIGELAVSLNVITNIALPTSANFQVFEIICFQINTSSIMNSSSLYNLTLC